MQNPISTCVKT